MSTWYICRSGDHKYVDKIWINGSYRYIYPSDKAPMVNKMMASADKKIRSGLKSGANLAKNVAWDYATRAYIDNFSSNTNLYGTPEYKKEYDEVHEKIGSLPSRIGKGLEKFKNRNNKKTTSKGSVKTEEPAKKESMDERKERYKKALKERAKKELENRKNKRKREAGERRLDRRRQSYV